MRPSPTPRSGADLRAKLAKVWARFDRLMAAYDSEMAGLIAHNGRTCQQSTRDATVIDVIGSEERDISAILLDACKRHGLNCVSVTIDAKWKKTTVYLHWWCGDMTEGCHSASADTFAEALEIGVSEINDAGFLRAAALDDMRRLAEGEAMSTQRADRLETSDDK